MNCTFALSSDGQQSDSSIGTLNNMTANWQTQFFVANSGAYNKALVTFHSLGSQSQMDNIVVSPLFDTVEEALADGAAAQRRRAQAFKDYAGAPFAAVIDDVLATTDAEPAKDMVRVQQAVDEAIRSYKMTSRLAELIDDAKQLTALSLPDADRLKDLCDEADKQLAAGVWPSTTWVEQHCQALEQAIADFLPMTEVTGKIQSPDFSTAAATGWQRYMELYRSVLGIPEPAPKPIRRRTAKPAEPKAEKPKAAAKPRTAEKPKAAEKPKTATARKPAAKKTKE